MPAQTRNRGLSAVLFLSTTLLIALATILQYYNGGSISSATALKDAAFEVLLNPVTTMIPVPFGQKGTLQVPVDGNKTNVLRESDLRHDAVGLHKRVMTW